MIRFRWPSRDVGVWLLVGLALREVFSFWTGHPFDTEIWLRNAYYVAHGWNPYGLLPPVPGVSFAYTGSAIPSVAYLPMWPLLLAGLYQFYALLGGGNRFVLYFLVKQPPILGDVLLGGMMFAAASRWGASRRSARRILALWMLFPYPIIISAIWGQFDSLVAALVLGSLLATDGWKRSSLSGLGVLLKSLPIIYVPYTFLRSQSRDRLTTLLSVAIPVGFTAAVFGITGWSVAGIAGTVAWTVQGFPQGLTYTAFLNYPAIGGLVASSPVVFSVFAYLWIPAILVASWWCSRRFAGPGPEPALQAFLLLTVVFFMFRWMVNEQYIVYLLPLLLLDAALWHPERRSLFHATWVLASAFLMVNNFFLVRFAAPAFAGALPFEFGLSSDPAFAFIRNEFLDAVRILFTLHLIQLALVIAKPGRDPTPWTVRFLHRVWHSSMSRLHASTAGQEE